MGETSKATLYNLRTGRVIRVLRGHEVMVNKVAFSPDGRLVATADSVGVVKLWSAQPGRELFEVGGWTTVTTYSRDGRKLAFEGQGGPLYVCDADSGRPLLRLQTERLTATWADFSPDGRLLGIADPRGQVSMWDIESAWRVHTIPAHERAIGSGACRCLVHSPDGRFLATGSQDRTVKIWDARTGILRHTLEGHSFWVIDLAFSPVGRLLATAAYTDPHIGIWDLESGKRLHWWSAHPQGVWQVRFTPDGRQLATSGQDGRICIWDVGSGRLERAWRVRGAANSLDFSPDGRRLVAWVSRAKASGRDVPSLQIWDPQQGRLILTLQGHTAVGSCTAFHPNGRRIVSGSDDFTVRQWEAFPWRESDYPSAGSEPLADRIRRYANGYWRERLEAERRDDLPEGGADRVVFVPFDRASLPKRDPATPAHLVDLTEHYTGGLQSADLLTWFSDWNNDLRELPSGRVPLGETEFDVRGMIRLKPFIPGGASELIQSTFPDRTGPIAVGRRVDRLHVLGSAIFGDPGLEGLAVARLIWRYPDGGQAETDVVYGKHLRHFWNSADPKSTIEAGHVAWTGSSPFTRDLGGNTRLYAFALENPRPEVEVTSLQWIGGISLSAPFIVAMTLEPGS